MDIITPQIEAVLKSLHDAPGRHYHVWRHPLSMRVLAARYAHLITDIGSVLAMIAFHDAVYDSRRNDNEERSADLAREMLSSVSLPPAQLEFILSGILATKHHLVPAGLSVSQGRDIAFLLDADLAILGASEEEFDAFDAAVREEYAWVTDEDWKVGRAAVMRSFLQRQRIYLTDDFRDAFEEQARRNMSRLLEQLSR